MKSGIYLLTFKDGSQYVGKSIDIERRWKEHAESMRKGKSAKNVQLAYNANGFPDARVLLVCHTDHIDLMETYYTYKLQPNLNSAATLSVNLDDLEYLAQFAELLTHSTADHIRCMSEYQDKVDIANKKYAELEKLIDEKVLKIDIDNDIARLEENNQTLEERIYDLEKELIKYRNKPWWKFW
jgi:hypothetical protein